MILYKFRGKQHKTGEWLEGDLIHYRHDVMILPLEADWFDFVPRKDNPFRLPSDRFVVDHDTVGQFTGLTDKDGKEIYEGDIIQHRDVKLIVEFYRGAFGYSRTIKRLQESVFVPFIGSDDNKNALQFSDGTFFDTDYCEVVGNIHDNPEMLEKGGRQ